MFARLLPGTRPTGAVGVLDNREAVIVHATAPLARDHRQLLAAVRSGVDASAGAAHSLRAEVSVIDALNAVGVRLTAQLDLDQLVQDATDATDAATTAMHDDDIALIHVRRSPAFQQRRFATARTLITMRHELDDWLEQIRLDPVRHDDVVLAAYEAMANAVEHGYRDLPGGELAVEAVHEGHELRVTVTDFGTWKPADETDPLRGRGLQLIETVADELAVRRAADSTTVTMSWTT